MSTSRDADADGSEAAAVGAAGTWALPFLPRRTDANRGNGEPARRLLDFPPWSAIAGARHAPAMSGDQDTRLWHPFADMGAVRAKELVIDRGKDVWVWDTDGRRYLDAT